MIGAKFGFSATLQAARLPVQTPVQTVVNTIPASPAETPKKKVVVVHKKNALADSGMIPAEIANKVYEPLNPECTMNLCEFLHNFWTPEKSEYIKNKRAHNKSIGDYHCKEMYNMVNRYWLPFFGEDFTVGDGNVGPLAQKLYDNIYGMQTGKVEDYMGWVYPLGLKA